MTELCRLTGRQGQGQPAGKEKAGCGWATFVGWGDAAGGRVGRAHWGAAQTTGKGTPPPREWATEDPCPCALPDAQPAPDEQAAGWGGWGHVRVPRTRPGKVSLPTSRQACPSPAPRSSPRSFPHLSPWRRHRRSAHPHLSLFIFGCAAWHVGSSVPSQGLNLRPTPHPAPPPIPGPGFESAPPAVEAHCLNPLTTGKSPPHLFWRCSPSLEFSIP